MTTLTSDGQIHLLDLGDGENRFSPGWVAEVGAALDEVAAAEGPRALVTVATGKYWSNGLDLDWVGEHPDQMQTYVSTVHALLARMLTLPVPSVAVQQGHTFAAGAMFALAHDLRFMRVDRGFFCLPEVHLGIPFTPGMAALIQARLTKAAAHESMTTGRRYGGSDALAAGIVDVALPESELLERATAKAAELAPTAGPTLAAIRSEMYATAIARLTER
ncbi:MAG: enoyl-CoA hydratase-related protein [Microthrixaceae bacterium]